MTESGASRWVLSNQLHDPVRAMAIEAGLPIQFIDAGTLTADMRARAEGDRISTKILSLDDLLAKASNAGLVLETIPIEKKETKLSRLATIEQFEDKTGCSLVVFTDKAADQLGYFFRHAPNGDEILDWSRSDELYDQIAKKMVDVYSNNESFRVKCNQVDPREFIRRFVQHWVSAIFAEKFPNLKHHVPNDFFVGIPLHEDAVARFPANVRATAENPAADRPLQNTHPESGYYLDRSKQSFLDSIESTAAAARLPRTNSDQVRDWGNLFHVLIGQIAPVSAKDVADFAADKQIGVTHSDDYLCIISPACRANLQAITKRFFSPWILTELERTALANALEFVAQQVQTLSEFFNDEPEPKQIGLTNLYALWDQLRAIPTSGEGDGIDMPYLHFKLGTPREDIWHWFEDQHQEFVVGDVMQGIRVEIQEATRPTM